MGSPQKAVRLTPSQEKRSSRWAPEPSAKRRAQGSTRTRQLQGGGDAEVEWTCAVEIERADVFEAGQKLVNQVDVHKDPVDECSAPSCVVIIKEEDQTW